MYCSNAEYIFNYRNKVLICVYNDYQNIHEYIY